MEIMKDQPSKYLPLGYRIFFIKNLLLKLITFYKNLYKPMISRRDLKDLEEIDFPDSQLF